MLKFEVLSLLQDGSVLTGCDAASTHSFGTMSIHQCCISLMLRGTDLSLDEANEEMPAACKGFKM